MGDRVIAFGLKGTVKSDADIKHDDGTHRMLVDFDEPCGAHEYFTVNGRSESYHKEPSLKHICESCKESPADFEMTNSSVMGLVMGKKQFVESTTSICKNCAGIQSTPPYWEAPKYWPGEMYHHFLERVVKSFQDYVNKLERKNG